MQSARWGDMRQTFFGDAPVEFDARVKVVSPRVAEDAMNVPVAVSAEALSGVQEVLVFADFNPILKVLSFRAREARPSLSFRMKLQQSSPVQAAARTADGVWHVGGTWVETTGGGCTVPSAGRASGQWDRLLGQVQGRIWDRGEGDLRVRLKVIHPMDTGLAAGIPAFYIERLTLADEQGTVYMTIETFEPVSENPAFSFDVDPRSKPRGALSLTGVDNNGNRIAARIGP
ncbi:MAG TPA: quinoprotein dehydrogenase-associated SoxYZ-like carrier [Burkholderiales bacterium]